MRLNEALKQAALRGERIYLTLCVVDSVDEDKRIITCSSMEDGTELTDIPLQIVLDSDKGLLIVPEKGSEIIIGYLDKHNPVVLLYSEVKKMLLNVDDTAVQIDKDGVVFNDGNNNGLVKIKTLEDNLDSLKKYVEGMNTAITTGLNGVGVSTAASGSAGASAYQGAMAGKFIVIKDMENEKVKH
jgi:hypothetical protein